MEMTKFQYLSTCSSFTKSKQKRFKLKVYKPIYNCFHEIGIESFKKENIEKVSDNQVN